MLACAQKEELQEQFVRDYQITCVGCDLDSVEVQDTQTYLIIIGVLSGCLLATILISLLILGVLLVSSFFC